MPFEKKIVDKLGRSLGKEGVSRFPVEVFFVPQYGKTSLGNASVPCFRKIPFENKFVNKMGGCFGREGVSRFSVKVVFLSAPKK